MSKPSEKSLIIYGNGSMAHALGHYVFQDYAQGIAAYTVEENFMSLGSFQGKPIVPFSTVQNIYAPEKHSMLIPLGYWGMNHLREKILKESKLKGYEIVTYKSPKSVISNDVSLNENTIIYELVIIRSATIIGANVIINAGANIGHNNYVGANSFIAAGVITGGNVHIGDNCVIGLGSIIKNGITIANNTFIGAGSVVVSDIKESGLYYGNPIKKQSRTPLQACEKP